MRMTLPAVVTAALLVAASGGCSDGGEQARGRQTSPTGSPSPSASPAPAIAASAAANVLKRYMSAINSANGRLDSELAGKVKTGSALQIHTAQYAVYKRNGLKFGRVKYTAGLAAAPRFSGYPRWFFAAATDRGTQPASRDIPVFVQEREGGPWRVAYTPFSATTKGPLAPGVDVEDFPEVVAGDDASLALPPGEIAAALADVISRGTRSPSAKPFAFGRLIRSPYRSLIDNRNAYQGNGWAGQSRAKDAGTAVYAVRTKSGGALVWFGVDIEHSYRSKTRNEIWESSNFGDWHKGFGMPSTVRSSMRRTERNELLAYIPAKGKGKVQIIANRWFPVSVRGR